MRAQQLFPIVLSVILSILMTACKDDPVSPVDTNDLKGVWLVESLDGEDKTEAGATWKFDETTASFTQALDGCRTTMNYSRGAGKIYMTLTSNGCGDATVGDRDTATYSITNGKLTVNQNGVAMVLRRPTGNDRIVGSWQATKIDGVALPAGSSMRLLFDGATLELVKVLANGAACNTLFLYDHEGTTLGMTVVGDECGQLEQGQEDEVRWVIDGDKLTLTFSDDTRIEANRL